MVKLFYGLNLVRKLKEQKRAFKKLKDLKRGLTEKCSKSI